MTSGGWRCWVDMTGGGACDIWWLEVLGRHDESTGNRCKDCQI